MLNLNVWKKKDLQHFVQMLNQCEVAGVTDIITIRAQLHDQLYQPKKTRSVRRKKQPPRHLCPDCNTVMQDSKRCKDWPVIAGLDIVGCPKCKFSRVLS